MDKNAGKSKSDRLNDIEDKRKLPVFAKYGLVALAVVVVVVIGVLIAFQVAGGYVATVDGQKITTGEYKYYLQVERQTMLSSAQELDPNLTADTFWATKIGGEDANEVAKQKALDQAQEVKVQYIKAKEAKISLTSDEIKQIDNNIQANIIDTMDPGNTSQEAGKGSKIRANKEFVKQYGFTLDDLRSAQLENYTVQKFQKTKVAEPTDAETNVDTNYTQHPDWYKEDTQFRKGAEEAVWARHILIKVAADAAQADKDAAKKKAEDLIAKLKDGADFATLAKENSEDGSKDRGGDYLFGKNQMYTEFETAAFALSPGQITETPVLTTSGYHIIQLMEKYAKDQPVSLKCAKEYFEYGTDFVKYQMYMERYNKYLETTVAAWLKEPQYKVTMNTSVYNSIKQ